MAVFSKLIPIPEPLKSPSLVSDLKLRLDWGEPALTIVDIRSRDAFNSSHIMGAISIPVDELVERSLQSLESIRDIYIYGATDEQAVEAVAKLREAGYQNVAEITGGLAAWKAVGYPIEGFAVA
ncbi:MAG: rhodanese-like domain-containing protein [Cyanobacteria bacterium SID2]|nr:rhodanese-like domain-containing protein [Cyanobacteria bacterium SID2]